MRGKKEWLVGGIIIMACLVLIFALGTRSMPKSGMEGVEISSGGEKIAVIRLTGPIYTSEHIVRQFKKFGEDRSIKGIIFRIDSPGGGVAASQEMYEAARRVRDSGKPVVASLASVAASGGYYAACGADTIIANPGSTTGSIGVIAQFVTIQKLLEKLGIEYETIASGRFKDTGSFHREMTPDDKRYLQAWIQDAYEQFVGVVSEERGMTIGEVKKVADGRVFTGRQALSNGLVDLLGDFQDAVDVTAAMAGIEGPPTLIQIRRSEMSLFDLLLQQAEAVLQGRGSQTLMYRYRW
ncbi:signal peptide peptidase SppA [bacterium]|nr:signal peptide peptidase SppA [bacterium]